MVFGNTGKGIGKIWHMQETMEKIVEWSEEYMHGGDVSACMKKQIEEFVN